MKKLYLDIDGVLLTAKLKKAADYLSQFIDFIISSFDCYWLTTHCKGDSKTALNYIEPYLNSDTIKKLEIIKPTTWTTLKTEAIDFESDFYWLEDYPLQAEISFLLSKDLIDRLIIVNLENQNELKEVEEKLKNNFN